MPTECFQKHHCYKELNSLQIMYFTLFSFWKLKNAIFSNVIMKQSSYISELVNRCSFAHIVTIKTWSQWTVSEKLRTKTPYFFLTIKQPHSQMILWATYPYQVPLSETTHCSRENHIQTVISEWLNGWSPLKHIVMHCVVKAVKRQQTSAPNQSCPARLSCRTSSGNLTR